MYLLVSLSFAILAADPSPPAVNAPAVQPVASRPATAQKRPTTVLRLDALKVEGRIQKPQAFYILQRSSLSFGELSQAKPVIPSILQSLRNNCF